MKPVNSIVAMTIRPSDSLTFTAEEQDQINWQMHHVQTKHKLIKQIALHISSDREAIVYTYVAINLIEAMTNIRSHIENVLDRKCDLYATAHSELHVYTDVSMTHDRALEVNVATNISAEDALNTLDHNIIHYEAFQDALTS